MQRKNKLFVLAAILLLIILMTLAACAASTDNSIADTQNIEPTQSSTEETVKGASSASAEKTTEKLTDPEDLYNPEVPLSNHYQAVMCLACQKYGVPYSFALAVAECESSFDMDADNGSCWGLMQIHPINYEWLRELGIEPTEYEGNITAGVLMLGQYLSKYSDTHKALMAYNLGETGARRQWNKGVYSTGYSQKVVSAQEKWQLILDK